MQRRAAQGSPSFILVPLGSGVSGLSVKSVWEGVWFFFDKVKPAYSSLESNSSWPGDDGNTGKVAATERRAWCVGDQETLSGQFCASMY